jgi:biotin operon repressor
MRNDIPGADIARMLGRTRNAVYKRRRWLRAQNNTQQAA